MGNLCRNLESNIFKLISRCQDILYEQRRIVEWREDGHSTKKRHLGLIAESLSETLFTK